MKEEIPIVLVKPDSSYGELKLHNGEIIGLGTERWLEWLEANNSFRFVSGLDGQDSFTARKHDRKAGSFWYAYRKVAGKLKNAYLGKSSTLSTGRMLEIANKLSEYPKLATHQQRLCNSYARECITEQPSSELVDCITDKVMQEKEEKIAFLLEENKQLQLHLEKLKAAEKDVSDQLYCCNQNTLKVADILKAALKLKSNAGGAIKQEINKALALIDDI